jgi:hypothetical protein
VWRTGAGQGSERSGLAAKAQRCNEEKTAVAAGQAGAWGTEAEEWRAEVARPQASCWLQGR